MSIARITEIKASSTESFGVAISDGIARAHKTVKNVKSAWSQSHEAVVDPKDEITAYGMLMKITFILKA